MKLSPFSLESSKAPCLQPLQLRLESDQILIGSSKDRNTSKAIWLINGWKTSNRRIDLDLPKRKIPNGHKYHRKVGRGDGSYCKGLGYCNKKRKHKEGIGVQADSQTKSIEEDYLKIDIYSIYGRKQRTRRSPGDMKKEKEYRGDTEVLVHGLIIINRKQRLNLTKRVNAETTTQTQLKDHDDIKERGEHSGNTSSIRVKHKNQKAETQRHTLKMDLTELVAKTQAWSCDEPVVTRQPRTRGNGELQMLVGKMIANRRFTQQAMKSIVNTAWTDAQMIEINEAANNTFVFGFPTRQALEKIWKGRPWKLSETLLVLKKWNMKGRPSKIDFSKCDIWTQVHDLPISWRTKEEVEAILGAQFPEVVEVDNNGLNTNAWVKFLRARVSIDLNQPLPYGFWASEEDDADWVNYKYEKLPAGFCYGCGRIGHSRTGCEFQEELVEGRYGDHSRAGTTQAF